jgi:AAA domain
MDNLGIFAPGFVTWQRALALAPDESTRMAVFHNACREVADYVRRGLDKLAAVDKLTEMMDAHSLADTDQVQHEIAEAFRYVEQPDRVPDDLEPGYANGKGNGKGTPLAFAATLYVWPDPAKIPPREWLYGGHYVRNCATATVAPGGYGKTTLTLFELITMALEGRQVWFISGEDPKDEVDRRIAAHCLHHHIAASDLKGRLYVDDRVSFPLQLGTCTRTSAVKFDTDWLNRLEHEIGEKRIDVTALDPFISFHSVPESDNGAIDQVIKRLALIAQNTASCIEVSHHTRKPMQGNNSELTVDDTRGGSAIINAVRSCRVINRMSSDEAGLAKISIDKRSSYVRIDKGKRNMAPSEKAQWWHIVSEHLPNGDNVQAIERWEFPSAFAGMSTAEIDWVQKLLKETGPRRASSQADDWLGHDLGRHCGRDDTHLKDGAIWANKILGEWVRNKIIKKIPMRDGFRKPNVPHYVHPDFVAEVVEFTPRKKAAAEKRLRILGPCPPETVCLHCQLADGNVMRIKDASQIGSKSETLHEECAESWFKNPQ